MLRGTVLAFISGWILWFWLDKNPITLGPLPLSIDGDFLHNFQATIDLLKQGRVQAAFIFVWKAHFIVLSIVTGVAIGMVFTSISQAMSRNRLLRLYLPDKKTPKKQQQE